MGLRQGLSVSLLAMALVSGTGIGAATRAQEAEPATNDPAVGFQWGLQAIGAPEAWKVGMGDGAIVAILDTGVHFSHEDLQGQLLTGRDFSNADDVAQDDNGQGTHLAGIIAARTNNQTGIAGIAPRARILPVKVLDNEDEGVEEHLLQGIRYAIQRNADVLVFDADRDIVLSEGGETIKKALESAWEAGVIPVLSAERPEVRAREFADVRALMVTGIGRDGKAPTYEHGVGAAEWGLAAPGGSDDGNEENDIISTYWPHTEGNSIEGRTEFGRYVYDGDNIQAAAHVAAAAAILRGLGQSPQQTVDRILENAREAGTQGRDDVFGVGVLHIGDATKGLAPARPAAAGSTATTAPVAGSAPGRPVPQTAGAPSITAPPGRGDPIVPSVPGAVVNPADPTAIVSDEEITGGFAANDAEPIPGRLPVLPLVGLMLLVGSAAITWALRRRTI